MKFSFDEFFFKNRYLILAIFLGLILISAGFLFFKNAGFPSSTKVEVLTASSEAREATSDIVVEISGEVEKPGVYKLPQGARIDDLLIISGGLSASSDRDWVNKNINRAAKLFDGQKIYIPGQGENVTSVTSNINTTSVGGQVNINTADVKTLDSLPGIGPVYAQKIIEHRPYSNLQDLVSKGVLTQTLFDKLKDLITVY